MRQTKVELHYVLTDMRKFKYEYYCNDCGDDFVSEKKETLCTQCLSSNIKNTAIEQWEEKE